MRTKKEFYADMLRYEPGLNRKINWSLLWLFGMMAVPLLAALIFPDRSRDIWMFGGVTAYLLYWWKIRILQRQVAEEHGMACNNCHKVFVLKHIGFTGVCSHCGTQAFTE